MRTIDTVVVGGGQAGLATSYHLAQAGRDHEVLEAGRIGETWRSRRWDSFTLVTPSWTIQLPGLGAVPGDPGGFLDRDVLVGLLEGWARAFGAPVREGVRVESIDQDGDGAGYRVATSDGPLRARQVVVAAGFFQVPRLPAFAAHIAPDVLQLDATAYRNPSSLPPGGVLVVGSGQSGTQIAEELHLAGRDVWLSVGRAVRLPRRYRGRDGMEWWNDLGGFVMTEDKVPDPRGRFAPNPHLSGARGGHTINLHRFARDGIRLIGRIAGLAGPDGTTLAIDADLHDRLRHVDFVASEIKGGIDKFVEATGLDAPAADATNGDDHDGLEGFDVPLVDRLDLRASGIGTVIWACGLVPDFSWIHLPIFDDAGQPIHDRGVTAAPGFAFVGLRFQRWAKSDLLFGVGEDAGHVVERLVAAEAGS